MFIAAIFAAFLLFAACEQQGGILRDEDATLKTLSVDSGTLSPAFSSSHSEYRVPVRNGVNSITITAQANSNNATVSGAGTEKLVVGSNPLSIVVTAENGDSKTYTITVMRHDGSVKGIQSAADMTRIGVEDDWSPVGNYRLENDITLADWRPIGDEENPFGGVFDGNKKKITLIGFDRTVLSETYLGIFGYAKGDSASEKAEIKNLTVDSSVNATGTAQAVGLVTGYAEMAEIENITLTGTFAYTSASTNYAGGAAGWIRGEETIIKNCNSDITMNIIPGQSVTLVPRVLSYSYVGGFAGIFTEGAGIENCHNTGDITADNAANAVSGQVFVGGIAGGSAYGFSTEYNGYIRDSSFTGILIGRAQGYWTFAGGIAGVICGGNVNNNQTTTRVERCFVSGTVSNQGDKSGYPYIGGVVAYNYYGALVSQSYFNGTIISGGKTNLYACGGVVGYHSQFTAPNNSRVEECYSGGTANINNGALVVGTTAGSALAPVRCYTVTGSQLQTYYEGWDFTNVWKMGADGYPQLKWQ